MTITLVFEILLIIALASALAYFMFDLDIEEIFAKLLVGVGFLAGLIFIGFFTGIGIHIANSVFGW